MCAWYRESFGEDYKLVYRHRNRESAAREIGAMMDWMKLKARSSVLDIGCGMGRHALALRDLGYKVTGLDLSDVLLSEAREHDPGKTVSWVQGDMRSLPFETAAFDAAVNWFTSFGYFSDVGDNVRVLGEMKRVLKPGGRFLIDFLNPAYLKQHLIPVSERVDEPTGYRIREARTFEGDFVVKRITVSSPADETGSASRHYEERVRLIELAQFEEMLQEAALSLDLVYGDYEGNAYETMTSKRLILLGRRDV